jgi:hypothetical protein
MPDVFISYKHRLRERVDAMAEALAALGLDVWYDKGLIAGDDYAAAISEKLRASKCVLVAWSPDAFPPRDRHGWVRGEAQIGRNRDVLIAVMLEPTDLDPPWNTVQYENLVEWTSETDDRASWRGMLRAIGGFVGRPGLAEFDQARAAGTATALTDWAREFAEDPLANAVWEKIKELEVAATLERVRLDRERKKPEVTPPPLRVDIPRPSEPKVIAPATPPASTTTAPPQSQPRPEIPLQPAVAAPINWVPLIIATIVNIAGTIACSFAVRNFGSSPAAPYVIFGGPVAGTLIHLAALYRMQLASFVGLVVIFGMTAIGFAVALLFMFSGLDAIDYNYSDPGWMEIVVGLVFGGLPLLGALTGVAIVAGRWASSSAWAKIVGVAIVTSLLIGIGALFNGFSIVRTAPSFPSLAAIWQIGYALGVAWLLASPQRRSASTI